ncbi:hypothetical protein GCM10022235_17320 [Kribbella ginsengisoli]|uniref:Uncharacterized protein n=1 Tax=Kribbella ginsengisoli TaxID=363865 RepID=A0ABP6WDZ9_9ACTN
MAVEEVYQAGDGVEGAGDGGGVEGGFGGAAEEGGVLAGRAVDDDAADVDSQSVHGVIVRWGTMSTELLTDAGAIV